MRRQQDLVADAPLGRPQPANKLLQHCVKMKDANFVVELMLLLLIDISVTCQQISFIMFVIGRTGDVIAGTILMNRVRVYPYININLMTHV